MTIKWCLYNHLPGQEIRLCLYLEAARACLCRLFHIHTPLSPHRGSRHPYFYEGPSLLSHLCVHPETRGVVLPFWDFIYKDSNYTYSDVWIGLQRFVVSCPLVSWT